ncbi:MFS transporter [Puniceicoccus vermicola]|uniref:MFS transporter n=1 Tax=Puniceicoccus vermicola TaxID=388746 RepID=A0A7X1AXA1_9BACT|nr:MFS transporter [Puniceicoccus vermicola]MBC2601691.1 MFS transporter [Puniceicoccus vermicola]
MSASKTKKPRSVQSYIDETPFWEDGTTVSDSLITGIQKRIWVLATAGKFFEGMVVFMTGVAIPLLHQDFGLTAAQKGIVGAAPLFGILIGATALGGLADTFGRKRMFIAEMILFVLFLLGVAFSPGYWTFVIFLFGVGTALGCDYPTAHVVISESIPSRVRGRLVLGAFAFQAVGALFGTVLGFFILKVYPEPDAWRWMYGSVLPLGVVIVFLRFFIPESAHWLVSQHRHDDACRALGKLLQRNPSYPTEIILKMPKKPHKHKKKKATYADLFSRKNRRATILAAIPWFLQDLGTYGIGIFTPTILATMIGAKSAEHNLAAIIHDDVLAAKGSAILDILLIVGIVCAVFLVDKIGRIRLQIFGFLGCAVGLLLAALSLHPDGSTNLFLIFVGFMLFNFMTNIGPNAMTYLIAGEVFPTKLRGKGAGFAASFAKIGAVTTAFLFPVLLNQIGTTNLLYILIGTSIIGAGVTAWFGIETKGINLESLEDPEPEDPTPPSKDNPVVEAMALKSET